MLNVNSIEGIKAQYDAQVKKLLSQKKILAWILKRTVSEVMDLTEETIEHCIEGEPEISKIALDEGKSNREIIGDNTESIIVGEGAIYYDIRFRLRRPKEKGSLCLIINVEAQKDIKQGYDIETRGIYYCARMVSSQKEKEFSGSQYNDIKKVYSIWICMNSPRNIGNAISSYHFTKTDLLGGFPDKKAAYDKMEMILIAINETETEDSFLQKMQILLSDSMTAAKKVRLLHRKYGVDIGTDSEEVINTTCNLSDNIYDKGKKEGLQEGRKAEKKNTIAAFVGLVNDKIITVEEAAKRLNMSVSGFKSLMDSKPQ